LRHDSCGGTTSPAGAGGYQHGNDSFAPRATGSGEALKRALDILVAASLLLLLAPAILILAAAIRIESRGGVFYRCRRVGWGGRELQMLKFRKMYDGAQGPALVSWDDERFTRIGAFLARTKLDELPQLWNVLKGEMSLVGPRPEDPGFVELYQEPYDAILAVRPGITGLSQLAFANESSLLHGGDRCQFYVERLLPQKVRMDRFYVARRSLAMDLRILAWTACVVLSRIAVAVDRQSGRLSVRRRPSRSGPTPATSEELT
jgi:lipopolysaccharide/colanic/teichoic acid biosynthesis glycosyltransferase